MTRQFPGKSHRADSAFTGARGHARTAEHSRSFAYSQPGYGADYRGTDGTDYRPEYLKDDSGDAWRPDRYDDPGHDPGWDAEYDDYVSDEPDDGYSDDEYGYYVDTQRWKWVAWLAAAVLVVAIVAATAILRSGDSTTTAGSVVTSATSAAPSPEPSATLPPETLTTVAPSAAPTVTTPSAAPTATAPSTAAAPPDQTAPPAPGQTVPPTAAAPPPQIDPRTIVYTVSGTKQPGDIVTITYTDASGALRTDFNVALPWQRSLVPGANVFLNSVTAASFVSRLNCSITDSTGQALVSQNYNTIAATCNR